MYRIYTPMRSLQPIENEFLEQKLDFTPASRASGLTHWVTGGCQGDSSGGASGLFLEYCPESG